MNAEILTVTSCVAYGRQYVCNLTKGHVSPKFVISFEINHALSQNILCEFDNIFDYSVQHGHLDFTHRFVHVASERHQ